MTPETAIRTSMTRSPTLVTNTTSSTVTATSSSVKPDTDITSLRGL